MENVILNIQNIVKKYDSTLALDHFGFQLQRGEILGLLGPNGAGKTTLISILSGTLKQFDGYIQFNGENLMKNRSMKNRIGIVPQEMTFYEDLNAMDNLMFWGGLYDIPKKDLKKRALSLLKTVQLADRIKEPVKNYSGGMKRRLNIAIGLVHDPELILLDEPTVGIDVQAKVSILEIIRDLGKNGTSVIFTTHQLAEVEEICSRIIIMDRGKKRIEGSLKELIATVGEKEIVEISGIFDKKKLENQGNLDRFGEILLLSEEHIQAAINNTDQIPKLMASLFEQQMKITDLKIKSPNLEAVFLKLTGRSLRD